MKLSQMISIEYAIAVLSLIYEKHNGEKVDYRLVFQQGSDIFTASLIRIDVDEPITLALDKSTAHIDTIRTRVQYDKNENVFTNIKTRLIMNFGDILFKERLRTMFAYPELLLRYLDNFTQQFIIPEEYVPDVFLNYSSLTYKFTLPFKRINTTEVILISLLPQN